MGEIDEQLEYTPYGELWVGYEEMPTGATPFRFTGKAVLLWGEVLKPPNQYVAVSGPGLGEYVPQAPINDDIRKQNQNLHGIGGSRDYALLVNQKIV
jgi:hypothetical protein